MRKIYITLLAAATLLLGCNPTPSGDEPTPTPTPTPDSGDKLKEFTVAINDSNTDALWQGDEKITVLRFDSPTSRPVLVQCAIDSKTVNGSSAKFTTAGYINQIGEQYAVMPKTTASASNFAAGNSTNGRLFKLNIGSQAISSDGKSSYPLLVGSWDSSSGAFTMVNPLSILKLTLKTPSSEQNDYTLSSLTLKSLNSEPLKGEVTVLTTECIAKISSAGDSQITIPCSGTKITKQGTELNIFIPHQLYSKGFALTLACTEGTMETTILEKGADSSQSGVIAAQVEVALQKSEIFMAPVRVTDSTIAIGWTINEKNIDYISQIIPNSAADYSEETTKTYKVALYSDAEMKNLVVSVDNIPGSAFKSPTVPPRFVFTGLKPSTEYYAMVHNTTDSKSPNAPLKVATVAPVAERNKVITSNATVGSLIVYENFEGIIYAGELTARAAGVSRSDRSDLTSTVNLTGEISLSDTGFILANAGTEIGLFNTLDGILDDMKLNKWGWIGGKSGANGGSICARPGYVKIGTTANRSFICTPIINALPAGKSATVRVVFKAAPYGDYDKLEITESEKHIAVKALGGATLASNWKMDYSSVISEQTLTLEGTTNTEWKEYSVTLTGVVNGTSIAIGGAADATTTNRLLLDDVRVYIDSMDAVPPIKGKITDQAGSSVAGVVVSDGFTVTKTDSNGIYEIPYNDKATFIFYTTPSQYEIARATDGYPLFYKSIAGSSNFDFTLGQSIAKQDEWHLYVMADPQTNQTGKLCIPYFSNYIATDIKAMVERDGFNSAKDWNSGKLAYGMVLGDVIWNSATESYMGSMKSAMAPEKTRVSWFTVPGNHDWYSSDSDKNPNLNCYHKFFGPSVYSFDRGDVHIVGMNNVITGAGKAVEDYEEGFTEQEYNWLVKDLEQVDASKCVVLCVHIPFFDGEVGVRHNKYYSQTLNLLKRFANAYIFSGHNHYSRHWFHSSYNNVHEINHGAACGQYWNLKICADGTPAGYYLYTFKGNDISNHLFKAAGTADYKAGANAMRIYLGTDSYDPNMLCGYGKDSSTVYVNLYNGYVNKTSDSSPLNKPWSVELFYKGSKVCDMTNVTRSDSKYGYHDKPSDYASNYSTWVVNSNYLRNDADWWFIARALTSNSSIKNRDGNKWGGAITNSSYKKTTTHIYAGTLPESVTLDSKDVMVRATAPTGQVYEVTTFTRFSSIDGLAWERY
ncbi:MAG: calcineurin-like phosphoesterase C-terminal domain-containing protein [Alistipes sp.]|nr:calcineurin-like phosphoesterase C-terminal domain-containing protein [Alistipes sp.]